MSPVSANCPACGGPIQFTVGSAVVKVCEYCRSAVARGDRKLVDLGKVADLVDTGSYFDIGMTGRYEGAPFRLLGRAQMGHQAGGVWDEWYAAFDDGRWGWVAEAQGRYYLTFRTAEVPADTLPPFDQLEVGGKVKVPAAKAPLVVAEKGRARTLGAEGDIPYRLVPGATYEYADLASRSAGFGTIDYSEDPPLAFLGREVTLDDLGVPPSARQREREARRVEDLQLACPQCGGPLALRAPDQTRRIACPNCGAMLDVDQGNLHFLDALVKGKINPIFPLGTTATFDETAFTIIGFMRRCMRVDGVDYCWDEYLLHDNRKGFRWLVHSEDHWNLVRSVPVGDVARDGRHAWFKDLKFRLFQKEIAEVIYVVGEFYWKVEVGERVQVSDYIRPPEVLSREKTSAAEGGEINWSLGTYLPRQAVEKACGTTDLPRPQTVGANQPFPFKTIYKSWAILMAIAVVLGVIFQIFGGGRLVLEKSFVVAPAAPAGSPAQIYFTDPFELRGLRNIRLTASTDVKNAWMDVDADLVNQATGELWPITLPVAYYFGLDEGESWSEGSQQSTAYLSAVPPGTYSLRFEVERERPGDSNQLQIRLEQGVPRLLHWFLAVLALSFVPIGVVLYHLYFESQRWKQSDYSAFGSD